jgi:hypothetical protein
MGIENPSGKTGFLVGIFVHVKTAGCGACTNTGASHGLRFFVLLAGIVLHGRIFQDIHFSNG